MFLNSQESILFDGTVLDNLRLNMPDAPYEAVIDAARVACAHDFIMKLPDGYNTRVGERGGGLSGGQKQRIAIARMVLQNPRLVILDEADSMTNDAQVATQPRAPLLPTRLSLSSVSVH